MSERITVEQHVRDPKLSAVIGAIARAAVEIAHKIRLAGLGDIYGAAGAVNVQGEQQQKLDVYANETLVNELRKVPDVAAAVSEEDDHPVPLDHPEAEYVAIFDPLDGSSNIDVNVNVGTIVSIQRVAPGADVKAAALQPGTAQVAALYVVYGPSTVLVLALSAEAGGPAGVASFTLDDNGEFVRTSSRVRMPAHGLYYSANEANATSWPAVYRAYISMLLRGEIGGKAHGARYIGSLVADFHRTLLKGGVFLYPPTQKAPKGKLRLLYEANPLAMIAEQAGGGAVNGRTRILEVAARGIHDRTPLIIGSRSEVSALQHMVQESLL